MANPISPSRLSSLSDSLLSPLNEEPFRFSFPQMPPVDDSKMPDETSTEASSHSFVVHDLTLVSPVSTKRARVEESPEAIEVSTQEKLDLLKQEIERLTTLNMKTNEFVQSIQKQLSSMKELLSGGAHPPSNSSDLAEKAHLKTIEQLAESWVLDENYAQAIGLLDTVSRPKETVEIVFWKAMAYDKLRDQDKSYQLIQRALKLDPSHLPSRYLSASILLDLSRQKFAEGNRVERDKIIKAAFSELETFEKISARSISPEIPDPNCMSLRIEMYEELGFTDLATQEFMKFQSRYPASRLLRQWKGKLSL